VRENGGLAARRLTPSNAQSCEEVQPDSAKRIWRVPKSACSPKGHRPWAGRGCLAYAPTENWAIMRADDVGKLATANSTSRRKNPENRSTSHADLLSYHPYASHGQGPEADSHHRSMGILRTKT
jgi:hypothetical protein